MMCCEGNGRLFWLGRERKGVRMLANLGTTPTFIVGELVLKKSAKMRYNHELSKLIDGELLVTIGE